MDGLSPIPLADSRIPVMLSRLASVLAALAVLMCGLPWLVKMIFLLVLLGADRWQQRSHTPAITLIGCEQERWWAVIAGLRTPLVPVDEQLVLTWLVVLHLRDTRSGAVHHLALWPDSAHRDDLRRLRVFLKYG
jgi:hypothetical protein